MTKPLTIYKASAGSGKTFTLATQYISLLVNNPTAFRNILAVTFTNKATAEMKTRILGQLYGIAHGLDDSKAYTKTVMDNTQMGERQVRERARTALQLLVHNYNYFMVETIDAFFQSVLRNLARELDLTANLRVGLNDQQVEEQAVDELIERLGENDKLFKWIMDYIHDNMDEDKSWNVIGKIKTFGRNIFKDFYKENCERLNNALKDEAFYDRYTAEMRKLKAQAQKQLAALADEFFDKLERHGLGVADFSRGKSGVCGYFLKLKNGEYETDKLRGTLVRQAEDDTAKWLRKDDADPAGERYRLVEEELRPHLRHCEELRPALARTYKSANLTLRHLSQLRLLQSIDNEVKAINNEANRFLLSDTQPLLHSLVRDSDSPFIFEKIGTRLEHIMIDEFQDTSNVQWQNFKVLLEETMSHAGNEPEPTGEWRGKTEGNGHGGAEGRTARVVRNMIVGDVKQSIYRWREGDWRLLNNIDRQFARTQQRLDIETLDTNFRSDRNIVDFNNAFFKAAARREYEALYADNPDEAEEMRRAYDDVEQKTPEKKGRHGLVRVRLVTAEDSYQDEMMKLVEDTVDELLEHGVRPKDIAVLVRSNQTIQDIADYFMANRPELRLVSDEAFRIDASLAVRVMVSAMRLLAHPDDEISRAALDKAKRKHLVDVPEDFFLDDTAEQMRALPLFDLAERIFIDFNLKALGNESAYVCAFFDQLAAFTQEHVADTADFLEEWDNNISGKSIQSDVVDGIRLITIHKSKGLEFDHVIMPFCDWKMEKNYTLWCQPKEAPYNQLPLVPIDFSATQMKGSVYEDDYLHEHLQNMVDNLNLLYVGFTRAAKNLFVYGKRGARGLRSETIEMCLPDVADSLGGTITDTGADPHRLGEEKAPAKGKRKGEAQGTLEYEFGSLDTTARKKEAKTENVFNQPPVATPMAVESYRGRAEFKQSNKSMEFIEGEDTGSRKTQYIKTGTVLHRLFSTIRTTEDVPSAIRQMELEGVLFDVSITAGSLQKMLRQRFASPQVRDWFSPKWKLFNECNILSIDPATGKVREQRPDRVMTDGHQTIVVDFKFGAPKEEHARQVKAYMDLLGNMGHHNVRGFLWYVYTNKIENVK